MLKHTGFLAAAALILALAIPGKPLSPSGSWLVDARHSDAQLSTDGTTDFGKTKLNITIGFARVNGTVKLDSSDSAKSAFDFRMYPASSMAPPIDEEGKVKIEWFASHANNTLVCFHSKGAKQTADGRLQTTGTLVLTRVDRNVELTPSEAYAGPVYGQPMIHRLTHEATFVFDFPAAGGQKDGAILASGSTKVVREDFPPLLKTVIATYWPPVVQDRNCQAPSAVGEDYRGAPCTGTFLMSPALPEAPHGANAEDYPGPANFNAVVGERLNIFVHMRLTPGGSGAQAPAGN
jgi:polyisoprenoid-binding protein YceI